MTKGYQFSPARFVLMFLGAGFLATALSILLHGTLGFALPTYIAALIPVFASIIWEARMFGKAEAKGPDADTRKDLTIRMAIFGVLTLVGANIATAVAMAGPGVLGQPAFLLSLGQIAVLFGAVFLMLGWFVFAPLARAFGEGRA